MAYDYQEEERRKDTLIKEIGDKIRSARIENKMSQLQVGVALGVSDKTISGYESGRIAAPIDKLIQIAELFRKPITYFLSNDPKDYKVSSRLKAIEQILKDLRKQLEEIKTIAEID